MTYHQIQPEDQQEYRVFNGKRVLNAHSRGGGRARELSPLVARLSNGHNIEMTYQKPKIDHLGKFLPAQNGGSDAHFSGFKMSNGIVIPAHEKHEYIYLLFWLYFEERPDLLEYVHQFDGARDFFDCQGGKPYIYSEVSLDDPKTSQRSCQGRAIAWRVRQRSLSVPMQELREWYIKKFRKIEVVLK